tara:strand:+ start:2250 stop:2393 length:144 start_codon:yes stop_codon:yes gene_type:complete
MPHEFSDIAHIEAMAKALDRICRGVQIIAVSGLAGLGAWHGFLAVLS